MELVRERQRMQAVAAAWRERRHRIGFVPTMGALHAGHLSLLERARPGCDQVVVSIFVNPIQFGPNEDFQRYPRDLDGDLAKLAKAGCDLVFAPEVADMVEPAARTHVQVRELDELLCGAHRPGHFRGVATVVTKLLHIVQPHVVVFGQKDAQQAVLLHRMLQDLNFPVEMRLGSIVREQNGLALSSRNIYLDASERREALLLRGALQAASAAAQAGERDAAAILQAARAVLSAGTRLRLDYVELVDVSTLAACPRLEGCMLLAVAAWVGATRLIDNCVLDVQDGQVREVELEACLQAPRREREETS